jgi:tRNA threonylcarbamoyladenosine biosynthesis protein TsaB
LKYLFIDSTYDLSLGILDDGLNWLSFETHSGQKASAIIQAKTFSMLDSFKIKSHELSGVIAIHGPGFYTGLRLSEGFADVFDYFGIKKYSFYSYEIPQWCGFSKGCWFTKAYRGEYFFFRWDSTISRHEMVQVKDLESAIGSEQFFIHSKSSLDSISSPLIQNPLETTQLLKNHPEKIFSEVLKDQRREPFYFRAPEDEFKVNP